MKEKKVKELDLFYTGELTEREEELLIALNFMINSCEPIKYNDFNHFSRQIEGELGKIVNWELSECKIGVATLRNKDSSVVEPKVFGITVFSVIATITDILVDKRLGFKTVDGYLKEVAFFKSGTKIGLEGRID